jgi:hypothetical protein
MEEAAYTAALAAGADEAEAAAAAAETRATHAAAVRLAAAAEEAAAEAAAAAAAIEAAKVERAQAVMRHTACCQHAAHDHEAAAAAAAAVAQADAKLAAAEEASEAASGMAALAAAQVADKMAEEHAFMAKERLHGGAATGLVMSGAARAGARADDVLRQHQQRRADVDEASAGIRGGTIANGVAAAADGLVSVSGHVASCGGSTSRHAARHEGSSQGSSSIRVGGGSYVDSSVSVSLGVTPRSSAETDSAHSASVHARGAMDGVVARGGGCVEARMTDTPGSGSRGRDHGSIASDQSGGHHPRGGVAGGVRGVRHGAVHGAAGDHDTCAGAGARASARASAARGGAAPHLLSQLMEVAPGERTEDAGLRTSGAPPPSAQLASLSRPPLTPSLSSSSLSEASFTRLQRAAGQVHELSRRSDLSPGFRRRTAAPTPSRTASLTPRHERVS